MAKELEALRVHEGLTDARDDELVLRARAGDDAALEHLLLRYKNFARVKARNYFLIGADKDDLVQEGMIGLYKAIRDVLTGAGVVVEDGPKGARWYPADPWK